MTITAEGGRKLASLTDDGRTYVTEHADELGTPWQDVAEGGVRPPASSAGRSRRSRRRSSRSRGRARTSRRPRPSRSSSARGASSI
ncbi:hypothetical protein NKG05_19140 [Oerskovia sp. M15]